MVQSYNVPELMQDDGADIGGTVRPQHDPGEIGSVQSHLARHQDGGASGDTHGCVSATPGNVSCKLRDFLRRRPRDQNGGPPPAVAVRLIGFALLGGCLEGDAIGREVQPGGAETSSTASLISRSAPGGALSGRTTQCNGRQGS